MNVKYAPHRPTHPPFDLAPPRPFRPTAPGAIGPRHIPRSFAPAGRATTAAGTRLPPPCPTPAPPNAHRWLPRAELARDSPSDRSCYELEIEVHAPPVVGRVGEGERDRAEMEVVPICAERSGCLTCGKMHTVQWRRGPAGKSTLCNACGLLWSKKIKRESARRGADLADTERMLADEWFVARSVEGDTHLAALQWSVETEDDEYEVTRRVRVGLRVEVDNEDGDDEGDYEDEEASREATPVSNA
ncbi:hypothetical protein BDK51DRAFT_26234 [Blyttiomyces helicus]|uniref:GATA-type domain-containing protein n=1 Tax=Blyttiomyces helicus TaxID=388810 RepID=A0A4P9WRJ8_9FUNG|nr:hypothetical protein BDK51DRAFT_26234 [Blyttiomyces helicus]|eukprot:RKO93546.1 hypothetical protein BDK51DRAFT_26234 [Blyttiomyces helicus]